MHNPQTMQAHGWLSMNPAGTGLCGRREPQHSLSPGGRSVAALVAVLTLVAAGCGESSGDQTETSSNRADAQSEDTPAQTAGEPSHEGTPAPTVELDEPDASSSDFRPLDEPLVPGESFVAQIGTHCGVAALNFGGQNWFALDFDDAGPDWIPREWSDVAGTRELLDVGIVVADDGDGFIATVASRSVTYRRAVDTDPEILCS